MDFEKLIDNNECLKAYFSEFPKKLKQLACEGKIVKFVEKGIEINSTDLSEYLVSKASIFRISTIMDFFETLQVLQFSRGFNAKNNTYFFINPNFRRDTELSDTFYKEPIDVQSLNELKGTKRMTPLHHIEIFSRLLRIENRRQMKITKSEYAQLKLKYILQRHSNSLNYQEDIIDPNLAVPDYIKNKEIAGYYGDVELSRLKHVFANYFPIYQEDAPAGENLQEQKFTDQAPEEYPSFEVKQETTEDKHILSEMVPSTSKAYKENSERTNDFEKMDDKENEPPKKKRKYINRATKITIKETNDALMNLEKEFGGFSNRMSED